MDLKLKEVAELLNTPEKTVLSWVKDRKLRAYKIYNQYRFNRDELNEWILKGKIPVSAEVFQRVQTSVPVSLMKLVMRGGICFSVEGATVKEVLSSAVHSIAFPVDIDREEILSALLEREEMMTTGLGEGIALPHPRNPILADVDSESVSICPLVHPVDFNAVDGLPVHTMIVILSANPRRHLDILSKVSFLCRQPDFVRSIKDHADAEEILRCVQKAELEMMKKKR